MATPDVAQLRARLTELFPAAAGFRTDYARSDDGASRRALVIESFDTRPVYVVVSEFPNARARSLSQIRGRYHLSDGGANEALQIANTLAERSDYAAWPARTDPRPARVASPNGIGAQSYHDYPGLGGHYRRLRGLLPTVDRIEIACASGKGGGGTRTKEWVTFRAADGQVLAELALNLVTPALREFYTAADSTARQLGESRLARWSQLVNVSFREWLAAIPEIEVLTSVAAVTQVHFER